MSFRKERDMLTNGINVIDNEETYANCGVCHERQPSELLDIWLPIVKVTVCKPCAKDLSTKLTAHLSKGD